MSGFNPIEFATQHSKQHGHHHQKHEQAYKQAWEQSVRNGPPDASDYNHEEAKRAHERVYQEDGDVPEGAEGHKMLGSAAAMQAMNMFKQSGSRDPSQMIGMAMSEATKLAGKSGGSDSDMNAIVMQATQMAMKMFSAQGGGGDGEEGGMGMIMKLMGGGGGGGGGGASGLMGLASKFM
ncbi:hypothetical protein BDK51DRAFT_48118 [Blyttiomyces helicus]|uniref:DUF7721 domain-containing protein n=1 Tax=Blyttiomyces helicus TaxID=388810 RepID=A0A4P9VW77_9FUNG|nr:hypothetical protein BDK51DRAFT_48118 [Blyttiomyces helicus]|eukprot:RKO83105.1 hypothetical protein BDK51DRAFT_48118 [Blyttiomyces helicus]